MNIKTTQYANHLSLVYVFFQQNIAYLYKTYPQKYMRCTRYTINQS